MSPWPAPGPPDPEPHPTPRPPDNEGTSFGLVDVRAEEGVLVLSGFEGNTASGRINRLLQDVDGLDMDRVSNEIVVQ